MIRIRAIDREGGRHELELAPGQVVMEGLRDLRAGVDAVCGGVCSCATCHVYVDAAWMALLTPRGADEAELLALVPGFKEDSSRLSCQIEVSSAVDGLELVVAPPD